jgi:hypothetical protein
MDRNMCEMLRMNEFLAIVPAKLPSYGDVKDDIVDDFDQSEQTTHIRLDVVDCRRASFAQFIDDVPCQFA